MGILGQQGTGRDLGRTQGDPDESAIALALSGGAELQWAVWPTNRPDNTTAWGHGMASDRWTHVAAVNDGRYTDLYIDGALWAAIRSRRRSASASTGKYWMLGATDYANVVEQTFNGLMGDVRIVDRALPPTKFMNAARTPVANEAVTATLAGRTIEVAVTGVAAAAAVQVVEPHTGDRFDLGTAAVTDGKARFTISDFQYAALGDGARVEVALDGKPNATLHLRADGKPVQPTLQDTKPSAAGGTVPATLALTLGAAPTFGAFAPGVTKEYTAETKATVVSTAADATLSVSDPGHLANGAFSLPEPLRVELAKTSWSAPDRQRGRGDRLQAAREGDRRAAHRRVHAVAHVHLGDDDPVTPRRGQAACGRPPTCSRSSTSPTWPTDARRRRQRRTAPRSSTPSATSARSRRSPTSRRCVR